jgi:galactose mutarotase-like enzyme
LTELGQLRVVSADGSIVAQFVPSAGMVCCSLRHHGEESLDARKGLEAYATHGSTMGIPLLYPWANRLGAYTYEVAGKRVTLPADPAKIHRDPNGLPIHGVAPAMMKWEPLAGAGRPAADTALTARLEWSSPELLALFPFAHEVVFEASAEPDALRIATTVRASAGQPVPVSFGFHPYLRLVGAERSAWNIELPSGQQLVLDERQLPTGERRPLEKGPIALADADLDDAVEVAGATSIGESAGADSPRFVAEALGRRIEVELLEGYRFGQVYSPRGSPFVCFEPMTAPGDALRSGEGLRTLAPGAEHRAVFRLAFG